MSRLPLLFLFSLVAVFSCEDSDDNISPVAQLHHDGNNASAPFLSAGTNHVAVMFTGDQVAQYNQGKLTEIQFFMANVPEFCQLDIYQGTGSDQLPETNIYSIDLSSEIAAGAWNRLLLDQDLTIASDDLWVTLTFNHPESLPLIGCDLGPQVTNGALILNGSQTSWQAYPFADINWNIRAGFTAE